MASAVEPTSPTKYRRQLSHALGVTSDLEQQLQKLQGALKELRR
jgi:hypothetical protein